MGASRKNVTSSSRSAGDMISDGHRGYRIRFLLLTFVMIMACAMVVLVIIGMLYREPSGRVGLVAAGVALLLVLAATLLFSRIGTPMVVRLEEHARDLEREIGERKRVEEELRALYVRHDAILTAVPDIIAEVDINRIYTWANHEAIKFFGEDVLGNEAGHYFVGEQDTYQTVQPLFNGDPGVFYVESWQRRRDGEKRLLAWWCRMLKDANGNVTGALSTARDITERKQAEDQRLALERRLHEAQRLESLGILAGGIAHDFNNLLVGVLGNAELALLDLPHESPALPCIRDLKKSAHAMAGLAQQMLAYSGKGKFVVEPVNLSALVEEMAHLLQASISKTAVMNLDLAPRIPSIEADASQMRQIVLNLITNASDAIGGNGGVISLRTGIVEADRKSLSEFSIGHDLPEGTYVYLEVSDTGCGMDPQVAKKIFDPFYTTKVTGRGLGLAAVLGIVRGHRGGIRILSEPWRGTTFKLIFPSVDDVVPISEKGEAEVREGPPGRTVLVTDDEEAVCAVTKRILERGGFDVLTARNGPEALELLRRHPEKIAVVLLDLTMPHMDGIELFREIRRLRPRLPVILSSGYGEQEISGRLAGKGLAGFIQKPYGAGLLIEKIRAALNWWPEADD